MTSSLLPQRILPITVPLVDGQGKITKDWWLFLYALFQGKTGAAPTISDLQALFDVEIDAADIAVPPNLNSFALDDVLPVPSALPELTEDLPPPAPQAQPEVVVTPGASPWTYTVAFNGSLLVQGGTVSLLELSRSGTFYTLGFTDGIVPVSRLDQLRVTYTGVPTVVFFPT